MPFFEMLISNCACGKGSDGVHRCNGDVIDVCKEGHNWTVNEKKNVVKVELDSWAIAVSYHEPIKNPPGPIADGDTEGEVTFKYKSGSNLKGVSPDPDSMKTINVSQLEKKS